MSENETKSEIRAKMIKIPIGYHFNYLPLLDSIKEYVQRHLKIGKRYRIRENIRQGVLEADCIKTMTLKAFYENFTLFESSDGFRRCYLYYDLWHNVLRGTRGTEAFFPDADMGQRGTRIE